LVSSRYYSVSSPSPLPRTRIILGGSAPEKAIPYYEKSCGNGFSFPVFNVTMFSSLPRTLDSPHSEIDMLTTNALMLCLLGWEKSCFNLSVMYKNGGDTFESCFREGGLSEEKNEPSIQTNLLPLPLV
jgi:hypothetical protein